MAGTLALVAVVARIAVVEVAAYGIATKAMYGVSMAFHSVRQAAAIRTARLLGARGEVAAAGALCLRCLGPYLLLLACFIALGGVFEGGGDSPLLVRITVCGVLLQLALARALSSLGLPGICLAMALAMAVQCAALARLWRRVPRQPVREGSAVRVG